MLYTPKCNSLLFASPVTYKNVASSQGSYAALTSHSVSFKMGTIRGFICAKYTIAHLRMHNTECQHFDNNGFTQREQRFHDIWLTRAMALQLKSKLVTRRWSKTTAATWQERTSMKLFNSWSLYIHVYSQKEAAWEEKVFYRRFIITWAEPRCISIHHFEKEKRI